MARAEGRARVVLPMDDNVLPVHYDPVVDYLIARLS
jgi:Phosphatase